MKKLKKLLFGISILIISLIAVGNTNTSEAATAGPLYLGIVSLRATGYGYQQSEKKVWKIAEYDSLTDTTADLSNMIYCIKAGPGFGSSEMSSGTGTTIRSYTQSFNLKDLSSISSTYSDVLPTGDNYNQLMWVIDHMYTGIGENDATKRNAYLESVIPNTDDYTNITDDDIDVVQQLAIWYFTNPSGTYHYDNIALAINAVKDIDSSYQALGDVDWNRETATKDLYKYFITNASGTYTTSNNTTTPISLNKTNATMQTIGTNYVAGPYSISELLDVDYALSATFTDSTTGATITPTYGVKDTNGNIVATTKTLKELVGTDFYLMIPTSSGIKGIKMTVNSSYSSKTVTYWSVENAPNTDQPVIIVEDKNLPFTDTATIVVPQPFDLSLRKFITNVNGTEITSRIPTVDTTALAAGTTTTATYNHTKNPIKVEVGDEVIYTIRIYNEGNVDGYAKEITDHLPPNLEFINDEFNTGYGWTIDSSDTTNKTIKTSYLSKEDEVASGDNLIEAFNGTTLKYKDLKIKCKVIATTTMPEKITNIAEITAFVDGNGNTVTDRDSDASNATIPTGTNLEQYKDSEINRGEKYIPGQEDDDDFEKLILKEYDLSLRKFITDVNGTEITSRIPTVDTTALAAGTSTTATYNHSKNPVRVEIGDTVVYTIRVYNEGDADGYASEVKDHLPAQLEYLPDNEINQAYGWVVDSSDSKIITTDYLSKAKETTTGANLIKAFDGTTLSYKDVKVACKVVTTDPMPTKITNIAEISGFTDKEGNTVKDRDSEKDNVNMPSDLPGYKDDEISKDYVPGQEDDDDFEKLMIKEYDLSLRKFITNVSGTEITSRIPTVDTTALAAGTSTTATYNHSKEPVQVQIGDTVIYTIRVYNEGDTDGYASEVKDHLPAQLEYLPDNDINKTYGWVVDSSDSKIITTDYLSKAKETTTGANLIKAFDGTTLSYKDVKVACKVIATEPMVKKITNIAEISGFTDKEGNTVTDRDSQEDNVNIPSDLPGYKDDEINKDYVPGQQDDDDFEKLIIGEFDLSLRKFITKINDTEVTSRIPVVDTTELAAGTSTTATYTHSKEPLLVTNSSIVTYTIRVYNEGEVDGYASLIKDDIPEGLEYLPDNETNKEYKWKMLDKDGKETTVEADATTISTDYLSKENEKTAEENLIKAFDGTTLSYKDVQVSFKVIEPSTSDRIIINQAQVAEDKDKNGNDVDDRDSTPDEWNDGEDDQDIEKIKVQYFDLALRKWVTQAIVTDASGKTTVTETGHKAEDDPEEIVKVDLKKSDISKVTVKFRYSIRVTNEGKIAGYAKEIKDYIPDGLKFIAEDNPLWTDIGNNEITTDQCKDVLLKPGESTEVEVILTWINGSDNMGLKDNWAEISKDYNDYDAPDIDSTPNNNKKGEDDIDDAPVLLSVKTGETQLYVTLTGTVLVILIAGVALIKKFVI